MCFTISALYNINLVKLSFNYKQELVCEEITKCHCDNDNIIHTQLLYC